MTKNESGKTVIISNQWIVLDESKLSTQKDLVISVVKTP